MKLRTYLFKLLDKDPCDSTDLKFEQLLALYPWITCIVIPRILGNSKIHSVTKVGDYQFIAFTKNDKFVLPLASAKMNNRSIAQKQYNWHKCHLTNFSNLQSKFCIVVINESSLTQIIIFPFSGYI